MRFDGLLAAAALVVAAGCTAHAPLRTEPTPVETSVQRLATEDGRRAAAAHSVEVHPEFTLAFVAFDDQGRFWDRRQLELVERTLAEEESRRTTEASSSASSRTDGSTTARSATRTSRASGRS